MKNVLIAVIVLALAGLGYYYFFMNDESVETTPEQTTSETQTESDATDTGADATEGDAAAADADMEAEAEAEMDSARILEDKGGDMTESDLVKEFTLDSFNYGYSQDEIVLQEGDTVTITLTNSDGFHDWVVDEFDAATERINEGETTTVTFTADEAGEFEFYCSVGNHREQGMVGTLVVQPASE